MRVEVHLDGNRTSVWINDEVVAYFDGYDDEKMVRSLLKRLGIEFTTYQTYR